MQVYFIISCNTQEFKFKQIFKANLAKSLGYFHKLANDAS